MKKAIIALCFLAALGACKKEEATTPEKIETPVVLLKDLTLSFESSETQNIVFAVGETSDKSLDLVVKLSDKAPENAVFTLNASETSTAKEGTHYNVSVADLTIVKDSTNAKVKLNILASAIKEGETLSLELSIGSEVAKVDAASKISLTINRLKPSEPKELFSEGFESGKLPTGWNAVNASGKEPNADGFFADESNTWVVTENWFNSGAYCAAVNSWTSDESGDDDWLITPAINLGTSNKLSFYVRSVNASGSYLDNIKVYLSESADQKSFTDQPIAAKEGVSNADAFTLIEVVIPAKYEKKTVHMAFRNDANGDALALDDIKIIGIE